jgi:hypothetical protein
MYRIDLIEEADRLHRDELAALTTDSRVAHCKQGADQSTLRRCQRDAHIFGRRQHDVQEGASWAVRVAKPIRKIVLSTNEIRLLDKAGRVMLAILFRFASVPVVFAFLALHWTETTSEDGGATRALTQNEANRKGLGAASDFSGHDCSIDTSPR